MTERDLAPGSQGPASPTYASPDEGRVSGQENNRDTGGASSASASDLKQKVSDDIQSAKQVARDNLAEATDHARDLADQQKNMIAEKMSGFAQAVEKVAAELEQGDQKDIGRLTRTIGSSMRRFSDDIKDRDLGQVASMAQDYGRSQPLAFLGVAALAGLAASRFLMASSSRRGGSSTGNVEASSASSGYSPSSSSTGFRPSEDASGLRVTEGGFNG